MEIQNVLTSVSLLLSFTIKTSATRHGNDVSYPESKIYDRNCCDSTLAVQQSSVMPDLLFFNNSSKILLSNESLNEDFELNNEQTSILKNINKLKFYNRKKYSEFNVFTGRISHNGTSLSENNIFSSGKRSGSKNFNNKKLSNIVNKSTVNDRMKIMKLEGNTDCIISKGNYINVCGQCLTESDDNKGEKVDACGVCEGENSCKVCPEIPGALFDDCGQCLKPTNERWNNCTKVTGSIPKVIDLALEQLNCSVILKGIGLDEVNLPELHCSINSLNGNNSLNVTDVFIKDEKIFILPVISGVIGDYSIICNSTNEAAVLPPQELKIVNSNLLSIIAILPTSIKLGQTLELALTIRGLSTLLDLICYIKDNNTVVATLPTNKIQGNPLIANVTCPSYVPKRSTLYKIGIVYTNAALIAVNDTNTKELIVEADAPILVRGGFTADLRRIWIEFDKNIDGEKSCSSLFTEKTYLNFGSAPLCSYTGNVLWVTLGRNCTIKSTDEIEFRSDVIRSANSDPVYARSFKGNVPLTINKNKVKSVKPSYKIVGSNRICPGKKLDPHKFLLSHQNASNNNSTEVLIRTYNSEDIKYNITVLFHVSNENMEPNKRQRKNLLAWFSVRQLQKSIQNQELKDYLLIDNSLLVPEVNYTLSIVGKNQFDDIGDVKNFTFFLTKETNDSNEPLDMLISGPYHLNSYADAWIESRIISSCKSNSELLYTTKYTWKLESNTSVVEFPTNVGPKLFLPGGTLKANNRYSIYSELIAKDTNGTILKGLFELETYASQFEIRIGVAKLVMGTGQSLDLWASTNLINIADDEIQYMWMCEYNLGKCFTPGPNSSELSEVYKKEFQQKFLKLKPGSLAVGRYNFRIKSFLKNENIYASTEPTSVTVVPGEQPKIQILKYSTRPVSPEDGISVPAKISNLKSGCQMEWEAEMEPGFDYLNVKLLGGIQAKVTLSENSEVKSKIFPLIIPGRNDSESSLILNDGASYKFTLSVYCGAKSHSSASIILYTDVLPKPDKLQVQPLEGVALMTEFSFSTERAYAPSQDHPLIYSFGYKLANESSHFVYSSSEWLKTKILIPSATLEGSTVTTLLKVCNVRQICVTVEGPVVHSTPPKTLSPATLRILGLEYGRLLSGQEYNEALSVAISSLKTLQTLPDKIPYNNISKQVESAIITEIGHLSQSLERKQMSVKPAVALLDTAATTLQYIPKSDLTLSQIIDFKKKILVTFNSEADSNLKLTVAKPVDNHSNLRKVSYPYSTLANIRIKRHGDINYKEEILTFDMIKTMMKASEIAIMNLSDSKKIADETKELLHNVEKYVTSLCDQVSEESDFFIGTKIAQFSVQKITVISTLTEEISVPHCIKNCYTNIAHVKLNLRVADSSKLSESICFAGVVYPSDYLSQIYNVKKIIDFERQSEIYYLILSPSPDLNLVIDDNVQAKIKIPLKNASLEKFNLKCYSWAESKGWLYSSCTTNEIKDTYILCNCPVNQYISVFATKESKTTSNEFEDEIKEINNELAHESKVTMKPDWEIIPLHSPEVIFRIDEDYESTVNNKKEEFEEQIRIQIINQLKIPSDMFPSLVVSPGSIIVKMQLVNGDRNVKEVLPKLVQALNYGELSLMGLDGSRLKVPPQLLQITEKQTDGEPDSRTGVIVICIILAIFSTIFVSVFITSLIIKRNRDKIAAEIAKNLEEPRIPKYRQLHFEESIDGSEKSLSQFRQLKRSRAIEALTSSFIKEEHDSGIGIVNDSDRNKKEQTVS